MNNNNDRHRFDGYRIPEDLVQTSLASIGINCSQDKIEKLCNDILHLGEGNKNCHPRDNSSRQLLLLKVNDVVEGLLTICESMDEEDDDPSNINGRPA